MNIWLFYGILFISSSAIVGWSFTNRNQTIAAALAAITIVFTRSIQVLNPYREFGDSYYYWTVPKAILRNNGLSAPKTSIWYPGIQNLLDFPGMHLTTAVLIEVTGFQSSAFARAIIPSFYAVVFFAVLVGLASHVVNSEWAVVVAYTTIQIDVFIFYQTEYHAQSFGLLFITFLLLVFTRNFESGDRVRNGILVIIALSGLALAHRFSSIIAVVLFGVAITSLYFYDRLPRTSITRQNRIMTVMYGLIMGIFLMSIHTLLHPYVVQKGVYRAYLVFKGFGIGFASVPSSYNTGNPSIVDWFSVFIKFLLIITAIPTVVCSFVKDYSDTILFMLLFLGSTGVAAVLTAIVNYEVVTRVVLVAFIPLSLIAFYTLQNQLPVSSSKSVAAVLSLLIVMMGVAGGTAPSLIDPSSDIRADGFPNVSPMSGEHVQGGYWIRDYVTINDMGVTIPTRLTATYFGHQSVSTTTYLSVSDEPKHYVVVDKARRELPPSNQIYSNGRILIGYNRTTEK